MLPLFSDQFPVTFSLFLTSQYSPDTHFFSLQHLFGYCLFLPCLKKQQEGMDVHEIQHNKVYVFHL